jgi:hypothetical protein
VTERQLAAIERARHAPVEIVEIRRERKRNLSFTARELVEFVQGNWADRERERLIHTWSGA